MHIRVIKAHRSGFKDSLEVRAGETLVPDSARHSSTAGWVWCTAPDGRAGWTPISWIDASERDWRIIRDYNARELDVDPGEILTRELEESDWLLVLRANGERGWIPVRCTESASHGTAP